MKGTRNKQVATKSSDGRFFFFPKNNPPITINAVTREEAEAKLKALNKKDND